VGEEKRGGAEGHQPAEGVGAPARHSDQDHQEGEEERQGHDDPDEPQLLSDHGEDEVRGLGWQEGEPLLRAHGEPLPQPPATADGDLRLDDVPAGGPRIGFRVEEGGEAVLLVGCQANPERTREHSGQEIAAEHGETLPDERAPDHQQHAQQQDIFNWGDGTLSGWVGPLNSGATATAKKTWTTIGTYKIKVIAKDSHGKYSVWSDPLTVQITGLSIALQNVKGGLFKVSAEIKNTGDDPVSNINWNITLSGGALIGKKTSGIYSSMIQANSNAVIQSNLILGLGVTNIVVNAWIPDGPSATLQKSGTIFLFFINVNP
jgi:hypothetical protein